MKGNSSYLTTGTDEHGQKVKKEADKRKMDVKKYCDGVASSFQKELSNYISSIYESGYQDGVNQPIKSNESMDLEFVMIAVRATEGVGKTLSDRIRKNIENLCFREEE